jgi:hypothetical protein
MSPLFQHNRNENVAHMAQAAEVQIIASGPRDINPYEKLFNQLVEIRNALPYIQPYD